MNVADTIREKLTTGLSPVTLEVVDDSAKHADHAGARPGGETHFSVRIVAAAFNGMNRVERQRRVYGLLSHEMETRVHALSLSALTPQEAEAA